MRKYLFLAFFGSILFSSLGQDIWIGNYLLSDDDDYQVISIAKKDGCYKLTWGSGSDKKPLSDLEKKKVACDQSSNDEFSFIVTLWESENYELSPIAFDESGRVSQFEVLGFDEETIFVRFF